MSDAAQLIFKNPANPLTYTPFGRAMAASAELFERTTRRYGKPSFDLPTTLVGGQRVAVTERVVWERPFGRLVHFERALNPGQKAGPKVLIVAPMSGHYATLLRGTVEAFLPAHEVYITDWIDARMVPIATTFDLDDYIDYLIAMFQMLGPDTHVMAVCQPAVPVIAAIARMEAENDPSVPRSMTLMGGPIDTRCAPTAVNKVAQERGIEWFKRNCVVRVPIVYPGALREVYPGYMQLSGFMAMNLDRHISAHHDMYQHLVKGDGDSAEKHRDFYDEYLAVMDLTAEFYLQTVDVVFQKYLLPRGELVHDGRTVLPSAITDIGLLTVEGELDDISGIGQTQAAHAMCSGLPDDLREDYIQPHVGHYGVFNGRRFREEIYPRVAAFIARQDARVTASAV
jgi:poly(3-hydroxybutyrate) depolymerase